MSACHYLKISFWATLLGIVVCALISMQTRVSDEGISRLNVDERRRIVKRLFSSSGSDGKRRIECRRRETFSNGPPDDVPTSINTGHYTCRGYSCLVPWLLQNRTSQLEGVSPLSCHAAMLLCIFVSSTVANFLATSASRNMHFWILSGELLRLLPIRLRVVSPSVRSDYISTFIGSTMKRRWMMKWHIGERERGRLIRQDL